MPTAINGHAELYVDLRHDDADVLAGRRDAVLSEAEAACASRGCELRREPVWSIEPRPFDAHLVKAAIEACVRVGAGDMTLPSGALHDAGELAAAVPTAMIFCASRGGLSHCPEEDSAPRDLACGIRALEYLTRTALEG